MDDRTSKRRNGLAIPTPRLLVTICCDEKSAVALLYDKSEEVFREDVKVFVAYC
jgi:hypothetical protein